jgi:hypothetical protein
MANHTRRLLFLGKDTQRQVDNHLSFRPFGVKSTLLPLPSPAKFDVNSELADEHFPASTYEGLSIGLAHAGSHRE